MEAFKMPMREIAKVYTKSELVIMAWRSAEMSANMARAHSERQAEIPASIAKMQSILPDNMTPTDLEQSIEAKLGPELCAKLCKMEAELGGIDLRKLTGDEMNRYMTALPTNGVQ